MSDAITVCTQREDEEEGQEEADTITKLSRKKEKKTLFTDVGVIRYLDHEPELSLNVHLYSRSGNQIL